MTKEIERPNKSIQIPSWFSQSLYAGGIASGLSFVFGVPVDYIPRIAIAGASYSLYVSYRDSRQKTSPKKRQARTRKIPFNSHQGSDKIDMQYSLPIDDNRYVSRETYWEAAKRLITGNSVRPTQQYSHQSEPQRPQIIDEFIFRVYFQGQIIELREKHVKLFLKSAYSLTNGKGLSERHWVRRRSQRPVWYKELSPVWFYGVNMLIWNAQRYFNRQFVITQANRQSYLAVEPRELYVNLKWYEYQRTKEK